MYNMIIVDDERYIREGLGGFDWHSSDIEIVGLFEHGMYACQYLSENTVDIILTDVRMPIMDGVQLIEHTKKYYPHTKVVMLTGYDDFEYVRASLRNGAVDYLLKPINEEQLFRTLNKVKQILNAERKMKNKIISLEKKAHVQAKLLRKKYIEDLLFNIRTDEEIEEISVYGEIFLESGKYTVCMIRLDRMDNKSKLYSQDDWKLIIFALENILNEIWDEHGLGYSWVNQQTADCYLIITDVKLQESSDSINMVMEDIKQSLYRMQGLLRSTISVAIGTTHKKREGIRISRCNVDAAMLKRQAEDTILICQPSEGIYQTDMTEVDGKSSNSNNAEIAWTGDIESGRYIIQAAKDYINKNYTKPITLSEVASYVYVSPSYLSFLFKEVMGINFIHYLTDCRIQKASQLLKETRFKVYQIGEMVGYENSRYFSEIFKKCTGMTPCEYRNS